MLKCYNNLNTALTDILGVLVSQPALTRVTGGDINEAFRVSIDGNTLFAKRNLPHRLNDFKEECEGLLALSQGALATAKPLAFVLDDTYAWLLLEWIDTGKPARNFWTNFAEQLANTHQSVTATYFGWQGEAEHTQWIDYFLEHKLLPKFEKAPLDSKTRELGERLLTKLDNYLLPPTRPQLVHGDLWHGNFMTNTDGQAVLIDPHAYYGHGEVDLALAQLFGGFHPSFYAAYAEAYGLEAGFQERADIYNLYHLLNHLILFGNSYLPSCQRVIQRYA